MSNLTFFEGVLKASKVTGAIAPSGKALAEKITDMAELQHARVIVEFGTGTGAFTEVILRKKHPDAHFISFEVNPDFVREAQKRCPAANIIEDSAENAGKYLQEAGHEYCDVIVSSLPWTCFDPTLQDNILNAAYDIIRPGGRFLTFAYFMSPYMSNGKRFLRGKLPERFDNVVQSRHVWLNIPPCTVFIADKH